ncbi:MAG TPA: hypothetical protein VL970_04845 [Candidatus Acidoferrales bacterium]|nr:hypothetical protein [Candidatus Acidoferrales bacterium]
MKGSQRQSGRSAFDLLEEATHLLRTAPVATLAVYYLGAIPFVLGLLYFWADLSRSPFAPRHLAGASFGMAALFLWLKFCHVVFARRVRAQAAGEQYLPPGVRRAARIFVMQAILQPSGLFVLPLALLPALPFPWVYAFYQNVAVLDDGGEASTAVLAKKSWRQAKLWPRQNHLLLAVAAAFAFCVFLNWLTVCLLLPQLFRMFFGMESNFTTSPLALLNTTFFAAMFSLTYLCVDPILKTAYALRCFYGDSLASGEDLKAELKPYLNAAVKAVASLSILATVFSGMPAVAAPPNPPAEVKANLPPADLDRAINQTIHERKYLWRMPREQVAEQEAGQGVIGKFFSQIADWLRQVARSVRDWLEELLRRLFPATRHAEPLPGGYGWIMTLQILLYGLAAVVIAALIILIVRLVRDRARSRAPVASQPFQPAPDLADEYLDADHLPADGWSKLAAELLERGEFRLALRAYFLASLAHLAGRNLISLARFKSNRDYERELHRRAHSLPDLPAIFGGNLSIFERVWYGAEAAGGELVRDFAARVEKLKATG